MKMEGNRKLIVAALMIVAVTAGLYLKAITGAEFTNFLVWIAGIFGLSNVIGDHALKPKPKDPGA